MTQTKTHCPGTEALSDEEALAALADLPQEAAWYAEGKWYGRKMCATCSGAVLPTTSGKLRKHVAGSNR